MKTICEIFKCHVMLLCSVQSQVHLIQNQNQNKAGGGEKIYSLQRMRALERSWLGWRLRTIKMIHLSKIKVSRTSRMLKFELFWLFLCIHWTVSKGCVLQDYQLSDIYKSWSVRFSHAVDWFHLLLLYSALAAAWLACVPHPQMLRSPDWDNQFLNTKQTSTRASTPLSPLPLQSRLSVSEWS